LYSFDPVTGARNLVNDAANPNSLPAYRVAGWRLLNARVSAGAITFDIPTLPGKTITVEYKDSLSEGSWTSLAPTISGDGTIKTVSYPMPVARRFYHLKVN
jgi:hypothetical protein